MGYSPWGCEKFDTTERLSAPGPVGIGHKPGSPSGLRAEPREPQVAPREELDVMAEAASLRAAALLHRVVGCWGGRGAPGQGCPSMPGHAQRRSSEEIGWRG